jgi:putative salt-induced outer membrane protein YdiY
MIREFRNSVFVAGLVLLSLVLCPAVMAADEEEEKKLGWSDSAELAYVLTAGNSETSTLTREWERALFKSRIAAIRAESTTLTQVAIGTVGDFTVDETKTTETTAENYFIDARYDRKITDRFFWYGLGSWFRNEFSGIQNRYVGAAGVGNIWYDREDLKFSTDYGVTFTKQEDVVEVPGADDTFPGLRFHWDYLNQWGKVTIYENELNLDFNVDESSDWRGAMVNSLTVAMSKTLALKVGLTWIYQNEPAYAQIPLVGPGVPADTTVPVQLDELDTIFTTSLVVTF